METFRNIIDRKINAVPLANYTAEQADAMEREDFETQLHYLSALQHSHRVSWLRTLLRRGRIGYKLYASLRRLYREAKRAEG